MSDVYGPFSVTPGQITSLGPSFTSFVGQLLSAESGEARMSGADLTYTLSENTSDGGIDAHTKRSLGTDWIPLGETAWQFKRSDLPPAGCEAELMGATEVHKTLNEGGNYRLVLGSDLTFQKIRNRRAALIRAFVNLGLSNVDDRIEILDAEQLARWTQEHPSLAVSKVLRGAGTVVMDFTDWSRSQKHENFWVPSEEQITLIEQVRSHILGKEITLHVEGVSGVGKTRAVLEALRDQSFEPIVTYSNDYQNMPPDYIRHLVNQDRSAVVVVDECSLRDHEKIAENIPRGSPIRLVTIGEPGTRVSYSPVMTLGNSKQEAILSILEKNEPSLWQEARTVVASVSAGNIAWALILARQVVRNPDFSVASALDANALRQFITDSLPTGDNFLGCSVLALFSRIGWEGGLEDELEIVASGLSLSIPMLREAGAYLELQGFFSTQGRFRSITPQPLALYLASEAWKALRQDIIENLVPRLSEDLLERLFARASEIGDFEPTRIAVKELVGSKGPFSSLEKLSAVGQTQLLSLAAIIAPKESMDRLSAVINGSSESELREAIAARRTMVYALEKLAWHSETFDDAEMALLKLARAENERYSNNSTGTWIGLFGALLPATGADPIKRLTALRREASSGDLRDRLLAVKGASHALSRFESVTISGEIQGGNFVERRGSPLTYDELWNYQEGAIALLQNLVEDEVDEVANAAVGALTSLIHPSLEDPRLMPAIATALAMIPKERLSAVRDEIAHLEKLFSRVEGAEVRSKALTVLTGRLPDPDPVEIFGGFIRAEPWEFLPGELRVHLRDAIGALVDGEAKHLCLSVIEGAESIPAAFELGAAMAEVWPNDVDVVRAIVKTIGTKNSPTLFGYLDARRLVVGDSVYQQFLDSEFANGLNEAYRLSVLAMGPLDEASWNKGLELLQSLGVTKGVAMLHGWRARLSGPQVVALLQIWIKKTTGQIDYNAAIGFASTCLIVEPRLFGDIEKELLELTAMRRSYPSTGGQTRDWAQVASLLVSNNAKAVFAILMDLIERGDISGFAGESEQEVLRLTVGRLAEEAWSTISSMIEDGSWRTAMAVRGWITESLPVKVFVDWAGESLARAQLLASVTSIGTQAPTAVARFLLTNFPDDERIQSSLAADWISGGWVGPESGRLRHQISQLKNWQETAESAGIKNWARTMSESLTLRLEAALLREAERGW